MASATARVSSRAICWATGFQSPSRTDSGTGASTPPAASTSAASAITDAGVR